MAAFSTLIDDFDDNSINSSKWDNWAGATYIKEQNSRIEVTNTNTNGSYMGMDAVTTYDFTNSYVYIEMIDPGPNHANRYVTPLQIYRNDNNQYYWEYNNGNLRCWKVAGGSWTQVGSNLTYNNTNHRWLRIRNSGTSVYFEYSADGTSWTTYATTNTTGVGAITAMGLTLCMIGNEGATTGSAYAYFDNFNTTPSSSTTPTVTTGSVTSITDIAATGNGDVTSDGGSTVTERGIVWKTSSGPTTSDNKATAAGTTGSYTASLTSLTPNTHYYVKAYAINANGTGYGSEVEFDTNAAFNASTGFMMLMD